MKKLIFLLLLVPFLAAGQMQATVRTYGINYKYIEYRPTTMKPRGVILFLHGLGERGTDISLVEKHEIPKLFKAGVEKPYIVIAPQLDLKYTQWPKNVFLNMFNILDTYYLDKHVTGLSLGGWGTYGAILTAYEYNGNKPNYFKTAAPVCGKSATTNWDVFKGLYIKIYHGTNDTTMPIGEDKRIVMALSAIDKMDSTNYMSYKFYEGYGHNIWSMAYNDSADGYWYWLDTVDPAPEVPARTEVTKIYVENNTGILVDQNGYEYKFQIAR